METECRAELFGVTGDSNESKGTAYLLASSKSVTRRLSSQLRGGKKAPLSSMTTWQWIDDARTQDTARTR